MSDTKGGWLCRSYLGEVAGGIPLPDLAVSLSLIDSGGKPGDRVAALFELARLHDARVVDYQNASLCPSSSSPH